MANAGPGIIIISGGRGAGKSTVARAVAARVPGAAGILTRTVRSADGLPVELEAEDIATGTLRPLASRTRDLGGPRLPGGGGAASFSFSAESFAWALGILVAGLRVPARRAGSFTEPRGEPLAAPRSARRGILIVDEIGPLELELGGGFAPFLEEVSALLGSAPLAGAPPAGAEGSHAPPAILFTVRPSLAGSLAARFAPRTVRILALDGANRDAMPELVASLV